MQITFINRMMGIKIGGGESFDINLARALKKRGHKIRFVIGTNSSKKSFLEDEFEVIYIKTPYLRNIHYKIKPDNFFGKLISAGASMIDGTLFENKAFEYLKKENKKSDIYQMCGLSELGERLEKEGMRSSIFWPGPPSFRRVKSIRACSLHFTHGDSINRLKEMVYNVYDVPPGLDFSIFYPPKEKKENKKVRFIFAGRLVPVKNIPFLIQGFNEAYKKNQNIELVIAGEGPIERELKKMVASDIKFLGFLNERELAREYRKADVFCITSIYESFSIVTLEAMASSLCVIVSNSGYLPKLAENAGIVVNQDDVSSLKEAILKLARDKKLRESFAKAGYEKVRNFYSWDKSAQKVEELYEKVLK